MTRVLDLETGCFIEFDEHMRPVKFCASPLSVLNEWDLARLAEQYPPPPGMFWAVQTCGAYLAWRPT